MIVSARTTPIQTLSDLLPPELCDQLDRLDIHSRRVLRGRLPGERLSRRRGRSVEFDDHRPYRPGDDLRHADWNIYARLDRLFIKLFREEEDLALHLLVDVSASMDAASGDRPTKRVVALRLAAALGYVALVNQNRLSVRVIGAGRGGEAPGPLPGLRGRRAVERLGRFLVQAARMPMAAPGDAIALEDDARRLAAQRLDRGVCVVLSDFLGDEDPGPGLRLLAGAGGRGGPMDGLCAQILDPAEIDPRAARESGLVGDLELIDAETGRKRSVTVGDAIIRRYEAAFERRQARLLSAARSAAFRHVLLTTDQPIAPFLSQTLRRFGVVRTHAG